jgi:hypothetical protein
VVSFDFRDRRGAERFAELLDETSGGRRHRGQHGGQRGQADEQLAELVAIGQSLAKAPHTVQVEPEFRTGLRAMLVATADRDGLGRTAPADETEPAEQVATPAGRSLFSKGAGRRIRARGAIVIGVAAGAMAVSGISAASENAHPGQLFYGVKRSTERAQLAMAGSDLTRGQLSLEFARNRLAEAAALPGDNVKFVAVLNDMDNDTKQGVRLLTGSAVAHKDKAPLGTLDAFVGAQRARMTPVLDGLNPANRQRAAESLTLLDNVHQRDADLRASLACETTAPDGSDTLGPRLDGCITGSDDSSPTQHQQGSSEKQQAKPANTAPTGKSSKAEPTPTGTAASPTPKAKAKAKVTKATATPSWADATPGQPTDPAVDPTLDDDSTKPLGGLLGTLLGSGNN